VKVTCKYQTRALSAEAQRCFCGPKFRVSSARYRWKCGEVIVAHNYECQTCVIGWS